MVWQRAWLPAGACWILSSLKPSLMASITLFIYSRPVRIKEELFTRTRKTKQACRAQEQKDNWIQIKKNVFSKPLVHKFHLGTRGLTLFGRTHSRFHGDARNETREKLWGYMTQSWPKATILELLMITYLSNDFGQITNPIQASKSNDSKLSVDLWEGKMCFIHWISWVWWVQSVACVVNLYRTEIWTSCHERPSICLMKQISLFLLLFTVYMLGLLHLCEWSFWPSIGTQMTLFLVFWFIRFLTVYYKPKKRISKSAHEGWF